MKKRKIRRKTDKQRLSTPRRHRPLLEMLEARQLLAGDLVLGPGPQAQRNVVPADIRLSELEDGETPLSSRIINDTIESAELVPLGFDEGEYDAIDLIGELIEPSSVRIAENTETRDQNAVPPPEDDGSILLANRVNHQSGVPVSFEATIGDSTDGHNSTTGGLTFRGDGDYYEFEDVEAGDTITAHLETQASLAIILYNEFGEVLQTNDQVLPRVAGTQDTYINYRVAEEGDYYVAIVPYAGTSDLFVTPTNPFDERTVQSGPGGDYVLTVAVDAVDVDYYALDLNAGDIFGVNSIGSANLISVYNPDEEFVTRSGQKLRDDIPISSPLPVGGSTELAYVATESGTYYIGVEGFRWSRYNLQMRLFRPAIESAPAGTRQILFLDFDGAEIVPDVFGAGGAEDIRELIPFHRFLPAWGLNRTHENELINKIVRVVDQDLNGDLQKLNPDAGVTILNSRDHADPYGQPFVSRVIVGGTQAQATIPTVGIANSIDVGNFDLEEDSLVLLDVISEPNGPAVNSASLNVFPLASPGSKAMKVDLVAKGVGGLISHEVGHFFGAYHTDRDNNVRSIMDTGGFIEDLVGVGDDKIFGTHDDFDPMYGSDQFDHEEGTFGVQDVAGMLSQVLVSGRTVGGSSVSIGPVSVRGVAYLDQNLNGERDAGEPGEPGIRIYADINHNGTFEIGEPAAISGSDGSYALPSVMGAVGSLDIRAAVTPDQLVVDPASGGYSFTAGSTVPGALHFGVRNLTGSEGGIDFGDAPASYGDASQIIQPGISLGQEVDGDSGTTETDNGDDGVTIAGVVAGDTASGNIVANFGEFPPGVINAWLDFNADGMFSSSEQILKNVRAAESLDFTFDVPSDSVSGPTWARFRLGYDRDIGPTGESTVGEVEDYAVTLVGGTGTGPGGNITNPVATNDTFLVAENAPATPFAVLVNDDDGGDDNITIASAGSADQGGSVSVSEDGQTVIYQPAADFFGVETFEYVVSNSAGSSTGTVTVTVEEDTPVPTDPLVAVELETVDSTGAVITSIASGGDFILNVYVDDVREDGAGVFAAYVDVLFDDNLASAIGPVTFGDDFPADQSPKDGVVQGVTNELDDFGAFAGFALELGSDRQLLFSIPMTAGTDGTLEFTTNPADNLPRHEVLLLDIVQPIPANRIDYGSVTLEIGTSPVPAAAFTNPDNRFDVNNDGTVSSRDALLLITDINAAGARSLDGSSAAISDGLYPDVNGDMNLSPVDVLQIINYLNNNDGAGEPLAAAAAVDAVFESAGDDDDDDDDGFVA